MKISVVTVCLNAGRHLHRLLESVTEQDWDDVEHVIIDGGSADGTISLIESYREKREQVIFVSEPDNGISDAMNKGLALAQGSVVVFLHADDYFSDQGVLTAVARIFAQKPQIDWLTGGINYVDCNERLIRRFEVRKWSYRRLLRGNIIFHPATFIRRELLLNVDGFDESLRYVMDYDLWLRIGRESAPYLLNRILACYRVHPECASVKNVDDAFREELRVRYRHLHGRPIQKTLHYIYYLLKRIPNRMIVRYAHAAR
ncbi:MAG TPA: glycosyltransferase family 2 protein [Deltaproteobacteria bacterium]|nr:glycosyltransferase family 2 protein [Deltaproteobacteria bacterium]HQB39845.1 glycosyltransferase family 2 protein [Deltaproteobacteria bacterium]